MSSAADSQCSPSIWGSVVRQYVICTWDLLARGNHRDGELPSQTSSCRSLIVPVKTWSSLWVGPPYCYLCSWRIWLLASLLVPLILSLPTNWRLLFWGCVQKHPYGKNISCFQNKNKSWLRTRFRMQWGHVCFLQWNLSTLIFAALHQPLCQQNIWCFVCWGWIYPYLNFQACMG